MYNYGQFDWKTGEWVEFDSKFDLSATTQMCYTFKSELLSGGHCFFATQSGVSCSANTTVTCSSLATTAGLAVGMAASGTNVAAGTVIASIDSATQVTLSKTTTGAVSSITFTGDVFKILLIKVAPTRTYDGTQTNVGTPGTGAPSTANVGTDETSGSNYVSGGAGLTNVSPSFPGPSASTATVSFSPNPSWTNASFSTTAAVIYNTSTRLGAGAAPLNGRSVSVHDFGGTQTVTNGTFTIIMPTNDSNNALLRLA